MPDVFTVFLNKDDDDDDDDSIGNCSVPDTGEGSGGPPIRHDACLKLKFLHRQDRISLFIKFSTSDNAFLAF